MAPDAGLPTGSHAVLIGVSAYKDAGFPPIRAARNSLKAVRSLLTDPALCGWRPGQITVITDPASANGLAGRIADLTETTTGVLLLYYVGHGVLSTRGELCLTVTSTRPDRPKISGLTWETVADLLRTSPAGTRLAILDCCFAGQAIEALSGDGAPGLADITHVGGVYTLTATTRNRPAHVPPAGEQDTACTSFTAELRDLVRAGIPGKPAQLTFGDIFPELRQRLLAKGLPGPSQRGTDTAHQFPFAANAAARAAPVTRAKPAARTAPAASARPAAPSAPPTGTRTDVSATAGKDRGGVQTRQARILAEALRAAEWITSTSIKQSTLGTIASAAATTDPDQAERIAQEITSDFSKLRALAGIAEAVAAADPARAGRLATEAEAIALAGKNGPLDGWDLTTIAKAMAATDPDRATRVAREITDNKSKPMALAGVAKAVAATDLARAGGLATEAERAARANDERAWRAIGLARIAAAVAGFDPRRAERLAADALRLSRWILDPDDKESVRTDVAMAVVATDPDRAERVVKGILFRRERAEALAGIAEAVAPTDPGRAGRLATDAERIAHAVRDEQDGAEALAAIAMAMAASDTERAVSIAGTISNDYSKVRALAGIVTAIAATDPGHAGRLATDAERIAGAMTDPAGKATALAIILRAVGATGR